MEKTYEIIKYYTIVHQFCCYASAGSTEKQNILQMSICFNKVLDDNFKIRLDESNDFVEGYKEYRNWLLEKYMNPSFSFSETYPNCFSSRQRKRWNTNEFEALYGAASKEKLFFAQTFADFSTICNNPFSTVPLSKVLWKMRLGAISMLQIIGYHYESDIESITSNLHSKEEQKTMDDSKNRPAQRVLRTAANGMRVWVPIDRLEAWEKAQADHSPEAEARRKELSNRIFEKLQQLREESQDNSHEEN